MRPLLIADDVVNINFLHFHFLFQDHWASMKVTQTTWLGEESLNLVQMKGLFKRELIGEE